MSAESNAAKKQALERVAMTTLLATPRAPVMAPLPNWPTAPLSCRAVDAPRLKRRPKNDSRSTTPSSFTGPVPLSYRSSAPNCCLPVQKSTFTSVARAVMEFAMRSLKAVCGQSCVPLRLWMY
eukprot:scaffold329462_cov72-Tisochrysis_lutea.AAC.2